MEHAHRERDRRPGADMNWDRTNEDVFVALQFLRKGAGVTQARLEQLPLLEELLRGDTLDSYDRLRGRLLSAIYSLDDDESTLLLDTFRLSPESAELPLLRERRALHGEKLGRGSDTVASREEPALQHLASRLLRGEYSQSPVALDLPEMHDGIVYESTTTVVTVENGLWRDTREHYRFVAAFDEMDYVTVPRGYAAVTTTDPAGRFRVTTRQASKGYSDDFWHQNAAQDADEPMRRNGTYNLTFRLAPPPVGTLAPVTVASRAFHARSLLATLRVRFIGRKPRQIWRHERVSYFEIPGQPNETTSVCLTGDHTATVRLRDLHGGTFFGIAWLW